MTAGCRFPLWAHDAAPDGRFCGRRVDGEGRSYCATHAAICYRPAEARLTVPGAFAPARDVVGLRAGIEGEP